MPEKETSTPDKKPKKRRFEGFIHQKIDANLQRALSFLAEEWKIPESEVPTRAILETATREALVEQSAALRGSLKQGKVSKVKGVTSSSEHLKEENEELRSELSDLHVQLKNMRTMHQKIRQLAEKLCIELKSEAS